MVKYIIKRLLHGILSIIVVIAIVMFFIYTLMDRNLVFAQDPIYNKQVNNAKITYRYMRWEEYGYLDYISYTDYISKLYKEGIINDEELEKVRVIGRTPAQDSSMAKKYIEQFKNDYEDKGYHIERLDAVLVNGRKVAEGGQQQLFAHKDIPLLLRLWNYISGLITIDHIYAAKDVVGERELIFTMFDPLYGGEQFAPAIMGNGTIHKYLLYFDDRFPFIHQNFVTLNLGVSYSVNKGQDVYYTMTEPQGSYIKREITYPTGLIEESADDLHTATYSYGSLANSKALSERFVDDYTNVRIRKKGLSKIGYSFLIGIISVALSYTIGIPSGILMARKKDKIWDKLGTIYIVFIIAIPSLAYIFLFKAIGGILGLPITFDMESDRAIMYVLPVISLALPAAANLMKWMRRYMIDQMNSDYVKFARAGGLREGEIFSKHILKNASIPIVHIIPGSVLGALTGAIITERVYVVPGAGNLLTTAVNKYDNGVVVGITLFYATLTVISIILGDLFMSLADPRISYISKER